MIVAGVSNKNGRIYPPGLWGAMSSNTKFRFRRREGPVIVAAWWYMDLIDAEGEIFETFEIGEPVEFAARYQMPDGRPPILWIESFKEQNNSGWVMGRIWEQPDLVRADLSEIKKLNPLMRLAAEAARS